jgi:serine/threonine-protein kinase HipA
LKVHLIFDDPEELALTLTGKKKRLKRENFVEAMLASGLDQKVIDNIFKKFIKAAPKWMDFIDISFLPEELKGRYKQEIAAKLERLKIES